MCNILYAVNQQANNISAFSINPTTGALTPLIGTVPTDAAPVELRFHPSGHFAYVANFNSSDVTVYRVDSTGALGLLGAVPARLSPSSISMHPSGRFAYVANLSSNDVTSFSIDQASGGLTPLGLPVSSGNGPTSSPWTHKADLPM